MRDSLMKFASSTDESLLAFYESVRRQVAAGTNTNGRYRLVGAHVRQYAEAISDEMKRRRLPFPPIDWPDLAKFKSMVWRMNCVLPGNRLQLLTSDAGQPAKKRDHAVE
jgi:hypothetical protein